MTFCPTHNKAYQDSPDACDPETEIEPDTQTMGQDLPGVTQLLGSPRGSQAEGTPAPRSQPVQLGQRPAARQQSALMHN